MIHYDEDGNGYSRGKLRSVEVLGFAETRLGQYEDEGLEDCAIVLLCGRAKRPFHFLMGYSSADTYDEARQEALNQLADTLDGLLYKVRRELTRMPG